MPAWHGNAFCITGTLWGESTHHRWIPLTKEPVMRSFDVLLLWAWTSCWPNIIWWFETPWCQCDVIIMLTFRVFCCHHQEERKAKKQEEEVLRREKRAQQMAEFAKFSSAGKPNFVITKKEVRAPGLCTRKSRVRHFKPNVVAVTPVTTNNPARRHSVFSERTPCSTPLNNIFLNLSASLTL